MSKAQPSRVATSQNCFSVTSSIAKTITGIWSSFWGVERTLPLTIENRYRGMSPFTFGAVPGLCGEHIYRG